MGLFYACHYGLSVDKDLFFEVSVNRLCRQDSNNFLTILDLIKGLEKIMMVRFGYWSLLYD